MNDLDVLPTGKKLDELLQAFDEIQCSRPPFVLKKFVLGARYTPEQQYAQCVLEMSIAYDNLRLADLNCRRKQLEAGSIDATTPLGQVDYEVKQIEIEQTRRAMLGSLREFAVLYELWRSFPRRFTRAELNVAQPEEFRQKLITQATQDLIATGRVGAGNQEGLRQLGVSLDEVIAGSVRSLPNPNSPDDVEYRYLEQGRCLILLAVPTEKKANEGLPCIEGLTLPSYAQIKLFNQYGNPVADAYTYIARQALLDGADYLMTVEDDVRPPVDAVIKLVSWCRDANKKQKTAVGAWYPKRSTPREGAHIIVANRERGPMRDDGTVQEAYTLAMGCSVYPVQMFREIPEPWFRTTPHLTQDSYFSQKAREAGWKLLVDTSIRCKHVDRDTGEVFE